MTQHNGQVILNNLFQKVQVYRSNRTCVPCTPGRKSRQARRLPQTRDG